MTERARSERSLAALRLAVDEPEREALVFADARDEKFVDDDPTIAERLVGRIPGLLPSGLGDPGMKAVHGLQLPYVCGEMANGIASTAMVSAVGRAGMLGFFGAAGLPLDRLERALVELSALPASVCWGSNLIHIPQAPELEDRTVDLYLAHGVRRVSASAFMTVRPSVARYSYAGVHVTPSGAIARPNKLFAKVSRPELAAELMAPPTEPMLKRLIEDGTLTIEQAALAAQLPIAEDITIEGDSGGHTDNRPLLVLLPAAIALRNDLQARFPARPAVRIGAAGGLGTPAAVAGAFALGAAYVLTGSINQCARESDQSDAVKELLARASFTDVAMAPAGDMFELGAKVQVLKRGTQFAVRATQLYDLYQRYRSLEELPDDTRSKLETEIFRQPIAAVWEETRAYFHEHKPAELERALRAPRHRMALVFRWYLGRTSRWAQTGDAGRAADYQIWCGPAMGAFNRWAAGSFLEALEQRTVTEIALNLMHGATVLTRARQLQLHGVAVPAALVRYVPRPLTGSS